MSGDILWLTRYYHIRNLKNVKKHFEYSDLKANRACLYIATCKTLILYLLNDTCKYAHNEVNSEQGKIKQSYMQSYIFIFGYI